MIGTFHHQGLIRTAQGYMHEYMVLCDNGVVFNTKEHSLISTGARLVLPDDACQSNSAEISWGCEKCGVQFEVRTCPGGTVVCPSCGHVEQVPENVILDGF